MNGSSFINSKKVNNAAIGYTDTGKEAVYEFVMPYFENAGGLGSTAHDLVNYMKVFLDKSNEAACLCLKKTVDIDVSSGKVVKMRPDNTAGPDVYSTALNWFKYQPAVSSSQIWADGGTNGFNSYLVMYPHLNSGVIILANKSDEKIFKSLPGIAYEISKAIDKK